MPPPASNGPAPEQVGPFQLTVLTLSVVALAAIAADTFLPVPHEVSRILHGVDLVACAVFFLDFVIRFSTARSKGAFMRFGWIDLLSSVPNVEFLRLGRLAAVFRVLRLLRGVRSIRLLLKTVYHHKGRGGVTSVILIAALVVLFGAIGVLLCETREHSNIRTAGDALWWSVTTVTTVGYGDLYPVTTSGRIVAATLMFSGVGLFGAFSGVVAMILLGRPEPDAALLAEIKSLHSEINRLQSGSATPAPAKYDEGPPP